MIKASQLKKGNVVRINSQLYAVRDITTQTPSARGAATLYKVRYDRVQTHQKLDQTYRGEEALEDVLLSRRQVEFSYLDGDDFVFMDLEDYNQYTLKPHDLGSQARWLVDGLDGITALLLDDQILAIELPAAIEAKIVETGPGMRGASATARTKPAKIQNGIEVQVPEYMENEETIRVSTEDGRFLGRA